MKEVLKELKNRINYLEKATPKLTNNQQENIMAELKNASNILKRMVLLCAVLSKEQ